MISLFEEIMKDLGFIKISKVREVLDNELSKAIELRFSNKETSDEGRGAMDAIYNMRRNLGFNQYE